MWFPIGDLFIQLASSIESFTIDNMDSKAQDLSDSDSNSTLCSDVDETSPLLESQPTKPTYVTCSEAGQVKKKYGNQGQDSGGLRSVGKHLVEEKQKQNYRK